MNNKTRLANVCQIKIQIFLSFSPVGMRTERRGKKTIFFFRLMLQLLISNLHMDMFKIYQLIIVFCPEKKTTMRRGLIEKSINNKTP
jgi:hypothetical protein